MENLQKKFLEKINTEIKEQISNKIYTEPLAQAVKYALFPGGKRIRPLFSAFLCYDLGGEVEKVIPAAVLVEYIHASSLVHDDLPAMDNDDMRRGRPSCHKAFAEATAILTGDALSVLPFEIIDCLDYTEQQKIKIVATIASAYRELCNGQQLDLIGHKDLNEVYKGKTGALFAASAKMAAIVTNQNIERFYLCQNLGEQLGVFFQFVDDYIDDLKIKGRDKASDEKNNKQTSASFSKQNLKNKIEKLKLDLDLLMNQIGELNGTKYILQIVANALIG